ncbi:MAG: hypothetical protein ACI8TQ_001162 [Planctomycetota bacterium]|jgi:hypothetical protein
MIRVLLVFGMLVGSVNAEGDLATIYPATLEHSSSGRDREGYTCIAGPDDVWNLRSFEYEIKDKFKVKLGACTVVIGHAEGNALWAYLVPKRGTKISTSKSGDGEKVKDIWIRFHPSRVGELFPAKTLRGNGDPDLLYWANRNYWHKVDSLWSRGRLPTVPSLDALVLDIDTTEEKRRVYSIDMKRGKVTYKGDYVGKAVSTSDSLKRKEVVGLVESAWDLMNAKYVGFAKSPTTDWQAVLEEGLVAAKKIKTAFGAGIVIKKMFNELDDIGLSVRSRRSSVTDSLDWMEYNSNWVGLRNVLGDLKGSESGGTITSLTPHDVGYIALTGLGDPGKSEAHIEEFDLMLDKLAESWALIIDLRFARIGDREITEQIVGRFIKQDSLYGYSQARSAEDRAAFGEKAELVCEARGSWTYEAPIYVITGPGTRGRAEELLQVLQNSVKVISMGSPTAGLSGSLEFFELGEDVSITFATERKLDPAGNPVTPEPIAPTILCEFDQSEFSSTNDPVLVRVLEEVLKTPQMERNAANPEVAAAVEGDEEGEDSEDDE